MIRRGTVFSVAIAIVMLVTAQAPATTKDKIIEELKAEVQDLRILVKQYKASCDAKDAEIKKLKARVAELSGKPAPAAAKTSKASAPAKQPSKTPSDVITSHKWVNLLAAVKLPGHSVGGKWKRMQGNQVSVRTQQSEIGELFLPGKPAANYGLEVNFSRQAGNQPITVVLPVGQTAVRLVLSQPIDCDDDDDDVRRYISGLEYIAGQSARSNDTTVSRSSMNNGVQHRLAVRVLSTKGQADIAVELDGKLIIHWRGDAKSLSAWTAASKNEPKNVCLVAGKNTSAVFHFAKVKQLSEKEIAAAWKLQPKL